MHIVSKIEEIKAISKVFHISSTRIALVPTMGYLHEGHLSLIRLAKKEADIVIVSRFVNPTQFAPNEDLDAYPNDPAHDHAVTKEAGADYIFEPLASDMYHENHLTWVEVPSLAQGLCGKTRPTHFRGVCTILTKLFNIIKPDVAVFGEKDWQQLTIIRQMVRDLDISTRIVSAPLVREEDGLAMSSRNAYLTSEERALASHIQQGLLLLQQKVLEGECNTQELVATFNSYIAKNIPMAKIDYIEIFQQDSLEPLVQIIEGSRVAVAVYLGKARLLDNISLK